MRSPGPRVGSLLADERSLSSDVDALDHVAVGVVPVGLALAGCTAADVVVGRVGGGQQRRRRVGRRTGLELGRGRHAAEGPEDQVALVVDGRRGVPLGLDRQDEVAVGVVAVAGVEELAAADLLDRVDRLVEDVVLGDGVVERRPADRLGVGDVARQRARGGCEADVRRVAAVLDLVEHDVAVGVVEVTLDVPEGGQRQRLVGGDCRAPGRRGSSRRAR